MAKSDGRLLTRTLSAVVLAPIVLGTTFWGGWPFVVMVVVVAWLMAWEWDRLWGGSGTATSAVIAMLAALAAIVLTVLDQGLLAILLVGLAAVLAWFGYRAAPEGGRWAGLGVLYIGLPGMALVSLRLSSELGLTILFWLLAVVWATDIGAYFAGRAIGGPKLAPRLSPNKTWAGLAGGMACAALAGWLAAVFVGIGRSGALAALSAALAVVAQAGDITESGIKRHFGVKDSSNLIPGHGGVLDRVDGLVFAAVAVAALGVAAGGHEVIWQ